MSTCRRTFIKGIGGLSAVSAVGGRKCPFCGKGGTRNAARLYSIRKIFWQKP